MGALDLWKWCLLLSQLGLGPVGAADVYGRCPGSLAHLALAAKLHLAPSCFQPAVCSDSPFVSLTCIPLCPIKGVTWCLGGKVRPHIGTPLKVPLALW